jgi:hypothetical protein
VLVSDRVDDADVIEYQNGRWTGWTSIFSPSLTLYERGHQDNLQVKTDCAER